MIGAGSIILPIVTSSILIIIALATLSRSSQSADAISPATTALSIPTESYPAVETEVLPVFTGSGATRPVRVAESAFCPNTCLTDHASRRTLCEVPQFAVCSRPPGAPFNRRRCHLLLGADRT